MLQYLVCSLFNLLLNLIFKYLVKLLCQPEKLVYSFVAAAGGDGGGVSLSKF